MRIAELMVIDSCGRKDFAMDGPVPEMNRRMEARKVVSVNTIVADKVGLARGQVRNISRRGCELCLTKTLRRDQYITLKVYLDEGPAMQIDLGKVRWVEEERAGVEFLRLSQQLTLVVAHSTILARQLSRGYS